MAAEVSVYLAGGMRGWDWRKAIMFRVGLRVGSATVRWLAPERLPFPDYVTNDLHLIRQSDIVFVYLEGDNPSGLGLAAEMGFARGLGKHIIFVNDKFTDRYTQFLRGLANYTSEAAYRGARVGFDDGVRQLIADIEAGCEV